MLESHVIFLSLNWRDFDLRNIWCVRYLILNDCIIWYRNHVYQMIWQRNSIVKYILCRSMICFSSSASCFMAIFVFIQIKSQIKIAGCELDDVNRNILPVSLSMNKLFNVHWTLLFFSATQLNSFANNDLRFQSCKSAIAAL